MTLGQVGQESTPDKSRTGPSQGPSAVKPKTVDIRFVTCFVPLPTYEERPREVWYGRLAKRPDCLPPRGHLNMGTKGKALGATWGYLPFWLARRGKETWVSYSSFLVASLQDETVTAPTVVAARFSASTLPFDAAFCSSFFGHVFIFSSWFS